MATNDGVISDYLGAGKVKKPKLPLVVVNTTAGTGSEVTRFAIITDPATSVKMLIADPHSDPRGGDRRSAPHRHLLRRS